MNSKHVILVDEDNNILGTEEKLKAHNANTPLHKGFSVFLFNSKKEFLIQRRNNKKTTWGGFWSNSFCGHPQMNETNTQAVYRHAQYELGLINLQQLNLITSNYRYIFTLNKVVENEICSIYFAISDDIISINRQEVVEVKFLKWPALNAYIAQQWDNFTPWSKEALSILENSKVFKTFMNA